MSSLLLSPPPAQVQPNRNALSFSQERSLKQRADLFSAAPQVSQQIQSKGPDFPLSTQRLATLLQEESDLIKCHHLHCHLIKIGLDCNVFFENMTLNMYGRCGALDDAHHLFLCGPKDTATWNAMISIFAKHGHHKEALQVFFEMQSHSVNLTSITFMSILPSCDHPAALIDGFMIHALIVEYGLQGNEYLESALITMYGKCGSIEMACILFNKLSHYNVVSWTCTISILASNGLINDAHKIFEDMQDSGMSPSKVTFLEVLSAVHDPSMVCMGNTVHTLILKHGLDSDCFLGTTLIKMYGKFSLLEDAQCVFDNLHDRNIVSWNVLIDAYAQSEEGERALQLFWGMRDQMLTLDAATYISALNACLSLDSITCGKAIHDCIKETQYEADVVVATALVNMYGRCGDLNEAQKVFESMCYRNDVSWNTLIGEYTEHGFGEQPLQFFYRMLEEGVMANRITYINILGACAILCALTECKQIHARILSIDLNTDTALETALINTYGKCGHLEGARLQFDRKQERCCVLWSVMISAYVHHGHEEEALALSAIMQQKEVTIDQAVGLSVIKACSSCLYQNEGRSIHLLIVKFGFDMQLDVGNALVNMYGKWGSFEEAIFLFHNSREQNVVSWNTMIGIFADHGFICEAMQWLHKMKQDHVQPDRFTFVNMLSCCGSLSFVEEGIALHAMIVNDGLEQCMNIGTTLISMYGKCGDLEAAHICFDKMDKQGVMTWNSMLSTYSHLGCGRMGHELYLCMLEKGPRPDALTFLSVISACSHEGLFDEGLSCFATMRDIYKIEPKLEHFGCMVDLYGRSGKIKEAERFITRMHLEGYALIWRTLLGSCDLHNNVEVGRKAGELAIDLDPDIQAPYILLSHLYAKNQMWKELAMVRERMIERGLIDCLGTVEV